MATENTVMYLHNSYIFTSALFINHLQGDLGVIQSLPSCHLRIHTCYDMESTWKSEGPILHIFELASLYQHFISLIPKVITCDIP